MEISLLEFEGFVEEETLLEEALFESAIVERELVERFEMDASKHPQQFAHILRQLESSQKSPSSQFDTEDNSDTSDTEGISCCVLSPVVPHVSCRLCYIRCLHCSASYAVSATSCLVL